MIIAEGDGRSPNGCASLHSPGTLDRMMLTGHKTRSVFDRYEADPRLFLQPLLAVDHDRGNGLCPTAGLGLVRSANGNTSASFDL
jgi:hypothetical protein